MDPVPETSFDYGLEGFLADPQLKGRVGLVTNASGRDRHGVHIAKRLAGHPRLQLVRLFSPEHGFWSNAPDAEDVEHTVHPTLGVPIISLFGPRQAPTRQDLEDLDLIVYDIQDVGVRFYTYISTLRNVIDSAAALGRPVHVLDRPNPIGGHIVEGPALTPGFESFVGHVAVPLRYGLTPGELARWYASTSGAPAPIVWPCRGYRRRQPFTGLGVPWTPPSPSMPDPATAAFYPGTCLFEGLNVSEGRGTPAPFRMLGAPWVNADRWLAALGNRLPKGVSAVRCEFRPTFGTFEHQACQGILLRSDSPTVDQAVHFGLEVIQSLMRSHPGQVTFLTRAGDTMPFFDRLAGNAWLREGLLSDVDLSELMERAQEECTAFCQARERFFLYD